jgi:HSP20 family protein
MEHTMENYLTKWNPFKFLRKTPDEKRAQTAASGSAAAATLPASWLLPSPFLLPDPFRALFDPLGNTGAFERWFGDFSPSMFEPRIDVIDDEDAIRITAELPGMDRQDLQIAVEGKSLVLSGEKKLESKTKENGCYRTERAFGKFQRLIPLPDDIDFEHAEASFDKGVLTVRLPKIVLSSDKRTARQLEIK